MEPPNDPAALTNRNRPVTTGISQGPAALPSSARAPRIRLREAASTADALIEHDTEVDPKNLLYRHSRRDGSCLAVLHNTVVAGNMKQIARLVMSGLTPICR
jgi:hypothetical protein